MLNRLVLFGLVSVAVSAVAACGPAEPPPAAEEAPPPPPPPPPPATLYDLGEVDIAAEEPVFTSRNVRFLGVGIGDITNDMLEVLGEQAGDTQNALEHYVTAYKNGGLVIHTFKNTGEIRKIEILTRLASEVASPELRAWLEDGDPDRLRAFMGQEEGVEQVPETGATEYVYDSRGIRFLVYEGQYGIRFSYYRD